jgi:hypothetical protein
LPPQEVVLLVRGVLKGESAASLARELGYSKATITPLRHLIQSNAAQLQTETPLADNVVEAGELFQNAGEKGDEPFDSLDPPRRRANKRRGRACSDGTGALAGSAGYESQHALSLCGALHPT